jgi:hypothetical protein
MVIVYSYGSFPEGTRGFFFHLSSARRYDVQLSWHLSQTSSKKSMANRLFLSTLWHSWKPIANLLAKCESKLEQRFKLPWKTSKNEPSNWNLMRRPGHWLPLFCCKSSSLEWLAITQTWIHMDKNMINMDKTWINMGKSFGMVYKFQSSSLGFLLFHTTFFVNFQSFCSYLSDRSQEVPVIFAKFIGLSGPRTISVFRGGTWRFPGVFQPVNQRITIFRIGYHVFGMRFPHHSGSAICRKKPSFVGCTAGGILTTGSMLRL